MGLLMTVILWIGILTVVSIIFRILWKFADGIEQAEQLDLQWQQYLNELQQYDYNAFQYWQLIYEQHFKKSRQQR